MPTLAIRPRPLDSDVLAAAERQGYTPLQARIVAGRLRGVAPEKLQRQISPSLGDLDHPDLLPDIDAAVDRIVYAITHGEVLGILSDHDADGTGGNLIIRSALEDIVGVPAARVRSYCSVRLTEGYGISDALVTRVLREVPPGQRVCWISSDQGSADEPRLARLKAAGHGVCVSDHHYCPDGAPPRAADACVNPIRADSRFPDRTISGCHTSLLVMAAVRERLIRDNRLDPRTPRLSQWLDVDAMSTLADAVHLGESRNNRVIVTRGLELMNSQPRPCWQAMRELLQLKGPFDEQTVLFQIAPRINARGRMSDAIETVQFLRAPDINTARRLLVLLDANNTERKRVQEAMTLEALPMAEAWCEGGARALVLHFPSGAPSVHGIVAMRVVEHTGLPCVCLSPFAHDPDIVTGSIRTIEQVHVRDALSGIERAHPGLLISAGGHKGAGGVRLRQADIERFRAAWEEQVAEQLRGTRPQPTLWTDGELPELPDLRHLAQIAAVGPYGRGYDAPVFAQRGRVCDVRPVGEGGVHLKLAVELAPGQSPVEAIWFRAREPGTACPIRAGEQRLLAFELDSNTFRGRTSLQLRVRAAA
jgi:single-stranded-DNA-specific exonuclease